MDGECMNCGEVGNWCRCDEEAIAKSETSEQTIATTWDHRIIDAVSFALGGRIGDTDDIERLKSQITNGSFKDHLHTACEIAVAFIRWSKDLKARLSRIQEAADADAADLAEMRDGTKLTRAGLVMLIQYQKEELDERDSILAEANLSPGNTHLKCLAESYRIARKSEADLRAELTALRAKLAAAERERDVAIHHLRATVKDIDDLAAQSEGVAGMHRNGDLATWEELSRGGRSEGWLNAVDDARDFLEQQGNA